VKRSREMISFLSQGVPLFLVVRARPYSSLMQLVSPAIVIGGMMGTWCLLIHGESYDFGQAPELQDFSVA